MAGRIGNLTVGLGLDAAEFTSGLNKAQAQARKSATGIRDSFAGNLLADFTRQAVSAIARLPGEVLAAVDAFNDLKDSTGASIENISAIDRVARETGVGFEVVSQSLIKLNMLLNAAKPDSDAARALQAIGLSAKELKTLDPAEALRRVAVALAGFADDGNKARIVQELFGKSLKEVAPLLNDLASKTTLVGTVSTEAALEAEKFRKEIFAIQANAGDFARAITLEIVTSMNAAIEVFRKGAKEGKTFFQVLRESGGKNIQFNSLTKEAEAQNEALKTVTDNVIALQDRLNKGQGNPEQLNKLIGAGRARITELGAAADATSKKLKALSDDVLGEVPDPTIDLGREGYKRTKPSAPEIADKTKKGPKLKDEYGDLIKSIKEKIAAEQAELDSITKLTPAQVLQAKIFHDIDTGVIKATVSEQLYVDGLLQSLLAIEQSNIACDEQNKVTKESADAYQKFLDSLRDGTDTLRQELVEEQKLADQFGKTKEEIEQLEIGYKLAAAAQAEFFAGSADAEGQGREAEIYREQAKALREIAAARRDALDKALRLQNDPLVGQAQAVKDYLAEIQRAGDATRQATEGTLRSLEDGLTEVFKNGGKGLRATAASIVDQIIAEFIRLKVVRPLLNDVLGGKSGGAGGGGLGSILGLFGSLANAAGFGRSGTYYGGTSTDPTAGNYENSFDLGKVSSGTMSKSDAVGGNTSVEIFPTAGQTARTETTQQGDKKLVKVVLEEVAKDIRGGGTVDRANRSTYASSRVAPKRG